MKIAIIMGSDSDWPLLEVAEETLLSFGIQAEVVVASAHRTPGIVHEFAKNAKERGIKAIIAAAGAAAHLPGVVAAYTTLPVIGVPINATPLGGMDALLSIAQMPAGIPVGCMAINGAKNAAIFAVEILAIADDELANKLFEYRQKMEKEVSAKAEKLHELRLKK